MSTNIYSEFLLDCFWSLYHIMVNRCPQIFIPSSCLIVSRVCTSSRRLLGCGPPVDVLGCGSHKMTSLHCISDVIVHSPTHCSTPLSSPPKVLAMPQVDTLLYLQSPYLIPKSSFQNMFCRAYENGQCSHLDTQNFKRLSNYECYISYDY